MKRPALPAFAAGLSALVAASGLVAPTSARAETAPAWCRLDDPGTTEIKRREAKIGNAAIDTSFECPSIGDPLAFPEELILPMPCGRRMVFRRVTFQLAHAIDHEEAHLGMVPMEGQANAVAAATNGPWTARVSGGFSIPGAKNRQRAYYIGKYEVMRSQYDLISADAFTATGEDDPDACRKASAAWSGTIGTRVLPAAGVTWFDAVNFANTYSQWLLARSQSGRQEKAKPIIPWEESAPGFVRLPTEAEWEFAARGGHASVGTQNQPGYDVRREDGSVGPGAVLDIASIVDAANPPPPGFSVQYVGRKQPNLLGLFDTVGNVDEFVLDPFRPLRPDAFAGQVGGSIVRGGNANEPASLIGVGYRREVPFYRLDGAVRGEVTGFRLVLSAPAFMNKRGKDWEPLMGNPDLEDDLRQARAAILKGDAKDVPGAREREAADEELGRLRAEYEDSRKANEALRQRLDTLGNASSENSSTAVAGALTALRDEHSRAQDEARAMQARLAAIQGQLQTASADVQERTRQARREQVRSAILTISAISTSQRMINTAQSLLDRNEKKLPVVDQAIREAIIEALAEGKRRIGILKATSQAQFRFYLDTVVGLSRSGPQAVSDALESVRADLRAQGITVLEDATDLADRHLKAALSANGTPAEAITANWLQEIYDTERIR